MTVTSRRSASIARHGSGAVTAVRALASQVHPVFMLPAITASLFGAVVAPSVAMLPAAIHALAIFFALYTAHVRDGYVDFFHRGEDDDHPLTARGCRIALAAATLGFGGCLLALWAIIGAGAVAVTLPAWLIAYHHAPHLDMYAVTATLGYPAGITTAILGGFYVQAGTFSVSIVTYAAIFFVTLAGVKMVDDASDVAYDRSIGKRTVAVALGYDGAKRLAFLAMTAGMALTVASAAVLPGVPFAAAAAPAVFGVVALLARRAGPELATMLLIRGVYLFLATILVAIWLHPLQ